MKYTVIIPARNEEKGIVKTLESISKQSLLPEKVIVVNDNSTDRTEEVLKDFAKNHPFLHYLNYPDHEEYKLGGRIIRMFKFAFDFILANTISCDYVVKMDADIEFDNDFFAHIFSHTDIKKYAIVSGIPYFYDNGKKIYAVSPSWHTNGDFKVYNFEFLKNPDAIPEDLGWDCADNIIAREKGWETIVLDDIFYLQNRPIGRYSVLKGRKRQGVGAYKLNYHPIFLLMKFVHDLFKPPIVSGAFYYLYGYFFALAKGYKKVVTGNQSKILRKLMWTGLKQRISKNEFYILQKLFKSKSSNLK